MSSAFAIREVLREDLMSRGYPAMVTCGPERIESAGPSRYTHRVHVDLDRESGDVFSVMGTARNPDMVGVRDVGYVVHVYARDGRAGALAWEHDAAVGVLTDGVIVALSDWAKATGATLALVSGRALTADEMQSSETATSAGYELRVRIGRAILRHDYDGSAADTATLAEVGTTTRVSIDDDTWEDI